MLTTLRLRSVRHYPEDLSVNEIGPHTRHFGLVVQCHHAGRSLLHSGHLPLITPHRQYMEGISGAINIYPLCGTSKYKHIIVRKQKIPKQIGVPSQNRRLFLRNKFTLVVYS